MKLLFMTFLTIWTMKILPYSLIILRHLKAKQHAEIKEKTIDEILSFKHQKMEELKAEIEELEEQKTQDDLGENVFPANPEVLQEDYNSDYIDKFLEYEDNSKIQEQDDEEATITIDEESVNTDNIEIKDDKLKVDDEGCNGPEYDDFMVSSVPRNTDPREKTGGEQFRCSHRSSCGADNESCHQRRQTRTFTETPR